MEILRRAPMLGVLAALASASAMYDRAGIFAFIVIAPAVYCAVMFCSYEYELPEQWNVFLIGIIICLLCSLRIYLSLTKSPAENLTLTNETGTVISVRTWGKRMYVAVIETDNGKKYAVRLQFMTMMQGDRILFDGVTYSFRPREHDNDFDESRYWGARGVASWISLDKVEGLPEKFSLPRMRYILSKKLTMYLPERSSAYLKAAWLGERDYLLNQQHRKWGTVHLLAVSGFHVGLAILCAWLIFGDKTIILSLILWAYVLLTGAAPSALRAGIMLQIALISRALGRNVSGVNAVSVAGVMILMYSPLMFWDIGFRLSMLAALTITTIPRKKFMWLMISPLISIVTFPQVSWSFGKIMLVGLVLNVIAPIYFAFALTIASGLGILRLLNVPLMNYMMLAVEGIFLIWEKTADFFAELIPYYIEWNYFIAWSGIGTLIFCLCKYFRLAPLRIIAVMSAGSFAAFVMFM